MSIFAAENASSSLSPEAILVSIKNFAHVCHLVPSNHNHMLYLSKGRALILEDTAELPRCVKKGKINEINLGVEFESYSYQC